MGALFNTQKRLRCFAPNRKSAVIYRLRQTLARQGAGVLEGHQMFAWRVPPLVVPVLIAIAVAIKDLPR
jgi:hypothetical protein